MDRMRVRPNIPLTSDPDAARIAQEIENDKIKLHVEHVAKVMDTLPGRHCMAWFLNDLGLFKDCFDAQGTEQTKKVVRHDYAIKIRELIIRCAGAEKWELMIREDAAREAEFEKTKQNLLKKAREDAAAKARRPNP